MSSHDLLGALGEDLELPLALRHLGVDALQVDAGIMADVDVLIDDLTGQVADVLVAHAGVVRTLRTGIASLPGTPADVPSWYRKYSCSKPIQSPASSSARWRGNSRGAVRAIRRQVHFAHHEEPIAARAIRVQSHRLEEAVRIVPFGLLRRAAVEAPYRTVC